MVCIRDGKIINSEPNCLTSDPADREPQQPTPSAGLAGYALRKSTTEQEVTMKAAQEGYEAYCRTTRWKSLTPGDRLPDWNFLPFEIRNAWFAAASAIRVYCA